MQDVPRERPPLYAMTTYFKARDYLLLNDSFFKMFNTHWPFFFIYPVTPLLVVIQFLRRMEPDWIDSIVNVRVVLAIYTNKYNQFLQIYT